jgi:hypothetical protein
MRLEKALAVLKAASYRVSKPRTTNPRPALNALGKPYGANYDPNYRMSYRAGSTAHLFKPYGRHMRFVSDPRSYHGA